MQTERKLVPIEPDQIHQMAFEEGNPADNGDGYSFSAEEFDLFVERLLSAIAMGPPAPTEDEPADALTSARKHLRTTLAAYVRAGQREHALRKEIGQLKARLGQSSELLRMAYNTSNPMLPYRVRLKIEEHFGAMTVTQAAPVTPATQHFRLLAHDELITVDDQVLASDTTTWAPMTSGSNYMAIGMPYMAGAMRPMRRAVSAPAVEVGEKSDAVDYFHTPGNGNRARRRLEGQRAGCPQPQAHPARCGCEQEDT